MKIYLEIFSRVIIFPFLQVNTINKKCATLCHISYFWDFLSSLSRGTLRDFKRLSVGLSWKKLDKARKSTQLHTHKRHDNYVSFRIWFARSSNSNFLVSFVSYWQISSKISQNYSIEYFYENYFHLGVIRAFIEQNLRIYSPKVTAIL